MVNACLLKVYATILVAIIFIWLCFAAFRRLNVPIGNIWAFLLSFIVLIGLTIFISKMTFGIPKVLVSLIMLVALAYIIYPLVASLPNQDVMKYFFITLAYFAVLSLIVFLLPENVFLKWGNVLLILLLSLIIFGLFGVLLFRNSPQFQRTFSILILIVFGLLVLYDTQIVLKTCKITDGKIDVINSSLSLLLDLVNIFGGVTGVSTSPMPSLPSSPFSIPV